MYTCFDKALLQMVGDSRDPDHQTGQGVDELHWKAFFVVEEPYALCCDESVIVGGEDSLNDLSIVDLCAVEKPKDGGTSA